MPITENKFQLRAMQTIQWCNLVWKTQEKWLSTFKQKLAAHLNSSNHHKAADLLKSEHVVRCLEVVSSNYSSSYRCLLTLRWLAQLQVAEIVCESSTGLCLESKFVVSSVVTYVTNSRLNSHSEAKWELEPSVATSRSAMINLFFRSLASFRDQPRPTVFRHTNNVGFYRPAISYRCTPQFPRHPTHYYNAHILAKWQYMWLVLAK